MADAREQGTVGRGEGGRGRTHELQELGREGAGRGLAAVVRTRTCPFAARRRLVFSISNTRAASMSHMSDSPVPNCAWSLRTEMPSMSGSLHTSATRKGPSALNLARQDLRPATGKQYRLPMHAALTRWCSHCPCWSSISAHSQVSSDGLNEWARRSRNLTPLRSTTGRNTSGTSSIRKLALEVPADGRRAFGDCGSKNASTTRRDGPDSRCGSSKSTNNRCLLTGKR
jgi:hypothetical protein